MSSQSSSCSNCKITGLPIYPTLYSVVPKHLQPEMPAGIKADRVKDVPVDLSSDVGAQYAYGLRVVRQGFLYLYYESKPDTGAPAWESYTVYGDGSVILSPYYQSPLAPLAEHSCNTRGHLAQRVKYLVIAEPEKCTKVWIAFSEHRWSHEKHQEYANDLDLRARRMQLIEPSAWVNGAKNPHAAQATPFNLGRVLNYRPGMVHGLTPVRSSSSSLTTENGDYNKALFRQQYSNYPVCTHVLQEDAISKQMLVSGKRPDGKSHPPMLFALWDAIGICHELNGHRNVVSGEVDVYHNERAMEIEAMAMIGGVKRTFEEGKRVELGRLENALRDQIARLHNPSRRWLQFAARPEVPLSASNHLVDCATLMDSWDRSPDFPPELRYYDRLEDIANYVDHTGWREARLEARAAADLKRLSDEVDAFWVKRNEASKQQAHGAWDTRWEPLIDRNAVDVFRKNYENFMKDADALRDERTDALLNWLESDLLVDTLEDYDKNNPISGGLFEEAVATAIFGIADSPRGKRKLEEWVKEMRTDSRRNLVWRSIALNQNELSLGVQQALNLAKANKDQDFTRQGFDTALRHLSVLKSAADTYKKAASVVTANAKALADLAAEKTAGAPLPMSEVKSKAFGVRITAANNLGLDKLLLTVGNIIYKEIGINRVVDSMGEGIVRYMLNLRAMVSPDDSAEFLKKEVEHRMAIRLEAKQEVILRESSMSRRRLEANRPGMSPEQYQALDKLNRESEIKKTGSTYHQRIAKARVNVAMVALELEVKARADQRSATHENWKSFLEKKPADADTAIRDVRLALVVGLIEASNFVKLLAWDTQTTGMTSKIAWTALASFLTMASAGLDIAATVAKSLHGADSMRHQQLKLMGGAASAISGGIMVYVDWVQADKEWDRGRYTISILYWSKAGLGGLSVTATALSTFSYAAPLVARITGKQVGKALAWMGLRAAGFIGARIIFMSAGMWITALSFLVAGLIIWLDDDALTKWCRRCAFSRWKRQEAPYLDANDQRDAFGAALLEVRV